MLEVFSMTYLWLKAGHIIFVIFWMAGLFMLPRYFIYHQEAAVGSEEDSTWLSRERKLLKIILNPSIVIVWVLGLSLAYTLNLWGEAWFLAKLAFVLGLSAYHGYLAGYHKKLACGERTMSDKQLRLFNEVPGVAAAIIVIMVIVRPF